MRTIEIDGSFGEGGGQILRTSLSLSYITGFALKLYDIRKGRKKPGLMQQHLTCVNAISKVCSAEVKGNEMSSTELSFAPGKIRSGNYFFDIKTAGSTSLVIQTLLPPFLFAGGISHITVRGGTHVPLSPTYDYLSGVFIPALSRIGISLGSSIKRYGFYPKGGGEVTFSISPAKTIKGLNAVARGDLGAIRGHSAVSNLPVHIAERQMNSALQALSPLTAHIDVMEVPSFGQGTFLFLKGEYEHGVAGFSSLGEKGKPAEKVGEEAAASFKYHHRTHACLDPHLADQIVLYLSLSRENSVFTTSRITHHLLTNLWVIEKFLSIRYEIEGSPGSEGTVKLFPMRD